MHPAQLWSPGDFSVHVTTNPVLPQLYFQYSQYMAAFLQMRCNGSDVSWAVAPLCWRPPCLQDLWVSDNSSTVFGFINRWFQYVSPTPARVSIFGAAPEVAAADGLPDWLDPHQPCYRTRFALEISQNLQNLSNGNPKVLHAYEVFEFRVGLNDDLPSRLFDFVSLFSDDWLYFPLMMKALLSAPEQLVCELIDYTFSNTGHRRVNMIANESLLVVMEQLRALEMKDGLPLFLLTSSHIVW